MTSTDSPATDESLVIQTFPLGNQWPTIDPFLFVAHHRDAYPNGTESMTPDASIDGRPIGQDFGDIDGWNMYHGSTVPGFPQHPHRGFETISYVRQGLIDHADSLGATARFGRGDVQWMTAGSGIVHAEMFPLVNQQDDNPMEMFQIWLNLPAADKMVDPYFTMLWSEDVPTVTHTDGAGRGTEVTIIAGELAGAQPSAPPPNSWASRSEAAIGLWHVVLEPHATWTLPTASADAARVLYAFAGSTLTVTDKHDHSTEISAGTGAAVDAAQPATLTAGSGGMEMLIMQGRPIGEPVARYGPFVMNTNEEIEQAFADYRRTQFGGWPWPSDDPVHDRSAGRFAIHPDGRREDPVS